VKKQKNDQFSPDEMVAFIFRACLKSRKFDMIVQNIQILNRFLFDSLISTELLLSGKIFTKTIFESFKKTLRRHVSRFERFLVFGIIFLPGNKYKG